VVLICNLDKPGYSWPVEKKLEKILGRFDDACGNVALPWVLNFGLEGTWVFGQRGCVTGSERRVDGSPRSYHGGVIRKSTGVLHGIDLWIQKDQRTGLSNRAAREL